MDSSCRQLKFEHTVLYKEIQSVCISWPAKKAFEICVGVDSWLAGVAGWAGWSRWVGWAGWPRQADTRARKSTTHKKTKNSKSKKHNSSGMVAKFEIVF